MPPRALALLLFALPAVGCATKGDLRNVTNELRMVRASQDSLLSAIQRQSRITQDSLRGTSGQMVEIRGTVNQQLGRMQEELAMVRQENAQLLRALATLREAVDQLARGQSRGAPSGYPMSTPQTASNPSDELYNAAQTAFDRGSVPAARTGFNQFIQDYPNDPRIANSKYRLAEMLVRENKKDEAITAFEKVANDHPTAPIAPEALFMAGGLYLDLQRRTEARAAFLRIVGSYGDSNAASRATEKLREIPPGQ